MSYRIFIDQTEHLVLASIQDYFDGEGFTHYVRELEAAGPFDSPYQLLVTVAEGTELAIPAETLRNLSARPPQFSRTAKRVIVAPGTLAFGLSRMFALNAPTASDQYSIVRSIDEAAQMLGIPEDRLDALNQASIASR